MSDKKVCANLLFLGLVFSFFLVGAVFAQEGDSNAPSDDASGDDSFDRDYNEEELIREAEEFDEEFNTGAGLTPDSFFYFLDGIIDSREEKIAEMRDTARRCNEGDLDACDALEVSFEKYREHADDFEKEVSPEQRIEAERSSRAIRGVVVREIAQNAPPTLKDDLIREVVKKEKSIEAAAEIADEIAKLCEKLINELGAYDKARDVCSLEDEGEDIPRWKLEKRNEWKESISEDGQKFFDVLGQCITGDCDCNDMPGVVQVDLCFQIMEADETGEDPRDLIDEFRESLPKNLKEVMDRAMKEFEEEGYERERPPECRDVDSFEECMLIMVEEELQNAPEPCREPIREGIRSGEVKGERDGKRICEEIMFRENAPQECIDAGATTPDECGKLFGKGKGPGIDVIDCEEFEFIEEKLNCYRDNSERVDFSRDYYDEKEKFRYDEGFDHKNFEKEFRGRNKDKYIDFAGNPRRYDRNFDREDHQRMVDEIIDKCESQGKPWFCDGKGENPCYCGENYEYRSYDEGPYPGDGPYDDESYDDAPYDCAVMYCQPGDYCDPYRGCVSDGDEFYPSGPGDPNYVEPDAPYDCSKLDCGNPPNYCDSYRGCVKGDDGYNPDGSSCNSGQEWCESSGGCVDFGDCDYGFENNCPEGQYYDENGDCTSGDPTNSGQDDGSNQVQDDEYDSGQYDGYDSGQYDGYDDGGSPSNTDDGDSFPSEASKGTTASVISSIEGNGFLDYYFK
jgi:hypothetical protein